MRGHRPRLLIAAVGAVCFTVFATASASTASVAQRDGTSAPRAGARKMSYLENGTIRVGVDLDKGGVITYLAPSATGASVINEYDLGREVQQAYYSGGTAAGTPCPGFGGGWNPIGAGDCRGHPSRVIESANDGRTIYVKSVPLQWAFENIPCDCMFEHWITIDGNTVSVHNKLTNNRSDKSQYPAEDQELPAVYTIGKLDRLVTYEGDAPFTNAPLTEKQATLPQAAYFWAPEKWAALVDSTGWGLGVFTGGGTSRFLGGFAGVRGVGGPADNSTGYVSPTDREVLDWNVVYEYDYTLILGTLAEIRAYAVAHRPSDVVDFQFAKGREGWTYVNATDRGLPIADVLQVSLDRDDPQLWSPARAWAARDISALYIRATYPPGRYDAQLFWASAGRGFADFNEQQSARVTVQGDGSPHTYVIHLAGNPAWSGIIGRLRFDPASVGGFPLEVDSISAKPPVTNARTDRRRVTLSISGRRAKGRLFDANQYAPCIGAQPTRIDLRRKSKWSSVAATRTGADGAYTIALPVRRGTFRAVVRSTHVGDTSCLAASSPTVSR